MANFKIALVNLIKQWTDNLNIGGLNPATADTERKWGKKFKVAKILKLNFNNFV